MNVLLATAGSRGDVQPLIALARALTAAGHGALLCAPPEHEAWVRSHGCAFRAVGSDIMAHVRSRGDTVSPGALRELIRFLQNEIRIQTAGLLNVLGGYGADLVIASSLMLSASTAAEACDCAYCYLAFCPQVLPSKRHPMVHIRNHELPKWLNRLSWHWFRTFDVNRNYRRPLNAERGRLGLPPVTAVYEHILKNHVIVASDEALGRVPDDVAQRHTQIGYCHLQQDDTLPARLQDFLASGPPPVFVGFGSMPAGNPREDTRRIAAAGRLAGTRLILSRGWAGLGGGDPGDDVLVVDDVPHAMLFPSVAAVVHHGGAGTTATAARAGVPQVIVPHVMDQFYWAHQIRKRRLGPRAVRRSQLTARRLAGAMEECLTVAEYSRRARACAGRLRRGEPLRRGVDLIQALGRLTEE